MRLLHTSMLLLLLGCSATQDLPRNAPEETAPSGPTLEVTAFAVQHVVEVAVTPEEAYDAFTGNITAWWDHSFAESPASLVIEPWPGGRFVETFREDSQDGVLHATVTQADRGKVLAFTGPLGFASLGMHFDMAHTLRFEATDTGTRMTMNVVGVGTIQPGWEDAVQRVWQHFLDGRFKPFVEGQLGDG